jgi:mannose-6-phosphate isomerase
VHAIGAGVMVLEVQEPSDTTFRVWDFDRIDVTGQKRPLHIEEALAVARFDNQPPVLSAPRHHDGFDVLCETRSFAMRAVDVNGTTPMTLSVSPEAALVLHAVSGDVEFVWDEHVVALPHGASCVLPASCGVVVFPARGRTSRAIVMS